VDTYDVVERVTTMKNITISVDDETLESAREYARQHRTSINALLRQFLKQTASKKSGDWLQEAFSALKKAGGGSGGKRWKREDLYDV
jgi:hypothetical protein